MCGLFLFFISISAFFVTGASNAVGQECLKLDKEAAKLIAKSGGSDCPVSCTGCGCKGGPGYRAPPRGVETKGRCVGYADLHSTCGPPPHAKCTRECTPVVVGCKRPDEDSAKEKLKAREPPKLDRKPGQGAPLT